MGLGREVVAVTGSGGLSYTLLRGSHYCPCPISKVVDFTCKHLLVMAMANIISPIRHLISLGISGILVSRLEKTRPGLGRLGRVGRRGMSRSFQK